MAPVTRLLIALAASLLSGAAGLSARSPGAGVGRTVPETTSASAARAAGTASGSGDDAPVGRAVSDALPRSVDSAGYTAPASERTWEPFTYASAEARRAAARAHRERHAGNNVQPLHILLSALCHPLSRPTAMRSPWRLGVWHEPRSKCATTRTPTLRVAHRHSATTRARVGSDDPSPRMARTALLALRLVDF